MAEETIGEDLIEHIPAGHLAPTGPGGMSLRDYFAGQALAGLCGAFGRVNPKGGETQAQADARWSYERADAMLAAREPHHG